MEFNHIPIMLREVIEGLNIKENGIYIDGTLGGGGHSLEIVKRLKGGKLIGIDQDGEALEKAKIVLRDYSENVVFIHDNYENINLIIENLGIAKVDGILLDIGVSSYQLDKGDRGFSHNQDAVLDMRMDKSQEFTAWDIINKYSQNELEKILWSYGEESWAKRIAEFIVKERKLGPINTTLDLVTTIKKAIPKKVRMEGHHPAKKTFQAVRIEVNREIEVLENSIEKMIDILKPGGRLAIISFHSLEDRIVKEAFNFSFKDCICPTEIPICVCEKTRDIKIITRKPIMASIDEVRENPRSRSAKLRIAEKL